MAWDCTLGPRFVGGLVFWTMRLVGTVLVDLWRVEGLLAEWEGLMRTWGTEGYLTDRDAIRSVGNESWSAGLRAESYILILEEGL